MAKADEVKALVDTLTERVSGVVGRLDNLDTAYRKTVDTLNEQGKELALLKQRVEDIRSSVEKWVMRIWALAGPIIGVLLAYFLGIKK